MLRCLILLVPLLLQNALSAIAQAPNAKIAAAAGLDADNSSPQQPSAGSASSDTADSPPAKPVERDRERRDLRVNPLTGQVTVGIGQYHPLTKNERLKLYFKQTYYSYGAYFGPFFAALALDQTSNSPPEWGGGFRGYGRRVASRIGSNAVQNTFQATTAAVLREDVRYIGSNEHGFKARLRHAVEYSFLTYNNHGRPTLNLANLGGYYMASAVSTRWSPESRGLARFTLSDGSEQIGLSLMVNLLQEFWPEVRHYGLRRP